MDHEEEEKAGEDGLSKLPLALPEEQETNQLKRRNSEEADGEKRLRENDEPPPGSVATSSELDNDPQMQVSSLESDYNELAVPEEAKPAQEDVPMGQETEEGTIAGSGDCGDDFDVNAKLREMGEISVHSVPKNEMPKRSPDDEEPVDEVSLTKRPKEEDADEKKKVTNLRKNIREVIDDTMLDASTLAAQREEQERLNRVQEQQRVLRALQRQNDLDKRQSSILSLLQGKLDTSEDLSGPSVSISAVRVMDKKTGQILEEIPDQTLEPGEIPNPMLCTAQLKEAQMAERGELGEKKDVVTIDDSSDDDCIMLSDEEEEPDGDDDPHNSGLHVNDSYNIPDDQGRVLINFGHSDTESDVFVAPQIARALKPHQIGGIRFLYDNIIESLDRFDSSTGFGCILAHSMGLGKTLQLVCFCDIFLRHTNAKTILCIMPINTLQNWLAEFNWWLPDDEAKSPLKEFGPVRGRNFKIHVLNDSQKTITARSKVVLNWSRTGGVLLIGYELYRLLCLKKVVKKKGKRAERDPVYAEKEQAAHGELLEEIYEALVKPGPDLVVCDEGHRIKSSHASTSVALKQIRTKRRVVLTGYPLQNNLLEYWCMVDFVRPNYLGTKTEFCNMFEKPIQNGQCIDSTPQDIKLMRYRAHVLHSLLLGFVQRRSHLVLQSTLPNKLEYVMLVRMTTYQRKLYDVFMNEVVRKKAVPNPLKAFAVCCKIWNHPDVLYNFLKKREHDLDLELEEELAMAEAKKKRKEREKKAKEEEIALNGDKIKQESEPERRTDLLGQVASAAPTEIVPKVEPLNPNYQATGMAQYGLAGGNNAYGYNTNTTDPLDGSEGAYDPYGNNNYYSAYNNHPSYQSADGSHLVGGGGAAAATEYDSHHHHQYYNNNQQGISMGTTGTVTGSVANKAKDPYWGNSGVAGAYGGMENYYGASGSVNQTNSLQYSQNYSMAAAGGAGTVTASDIPTTVADVTNNVGVGMPKESDGEKGKSGEKKPAKEDLFTEPDSPPEKELKSNKDDGIPYDWAVELMKDYVPDLLENAPKMEIFFCILNESLAVGDRILVFSQSLLTLNLIERYLQKNKVYGKEEHWAKNTNYFRLDGSTTACDRERLINEFNTNDEVAIFLVSTRAGSLGINLVGANRVIVFDASWNPCHDTQAVCRVYRYGQKKQCYVYRMVMDNCLEKRIYDRQVNKQGMSDRVVDECNPDAHLSIKEVTNLCWDNDEETEVKDFSDVKDQYPDVVMQKVLEKYSTSLSKEPFRHESLLVDRKEKKLSMAEKRLAQRGYELEKQASTKTAYNYSGKVTQYRVFRTADGALVHRPVGAVQTIAGTTGGAPSSKWIPAEVWQQQGMTTQETTLPADVTIPSNSSDKNGGILLKAGQKVMILKSSKGVYMQLETGKIIAIRTGPKNPAGSHTTMNIPRPRGFGDVNEVIKLDDDDEEEGEVVVGGKALTVKQKLKDKVAAPKEEPATTTTSKKNVKEVLPTPPSTEVNKPASDPVNHSYQIPGQSSGYYNNSSSYASGTYNSGGGYRQQQFDIASSSGKSQTSTRDYNSYSSGSNSSGYDGRVASGGGGAADYQQKSFPQQGLHDLPGQAANPATAHASTAGVGYGGRGGGGGTAYGSHYGSAAAADPMPTNGQYGGQPVPQHRSAAPAAAAPPPPAYPQSGYDYSNRYYDTQTKPLASQYTGHASHYPAPASAYPMSQSSAAVYSNAAAYQYGQHRPGEYNPNNPPYYMTPFAGAAGGYPSQPYGQGAVPGQHAQQQQQPQQSPIVQNLPASHQQPQQQQAPSYPEANGSYGGSYASQYNGPSTALPQLGKVDPPATGTTSKRKESSSSSSKKKSDSAFHKPSAAEIPEVKLEKKDAAAAASAPTNYYDRAMSAAASGSYSGYSPAYLGGPSPYNYPPSSYFYPTSYCAPSSAAASTTAATSTDPAPPPPPAGGREAKESKGNGTDAAVMGKYYDLSRNGPQHYHPKW